ncbi:MAG TPA: ABC-type transport auxiliary lipoprotein family protein, partial [Rhodopila sp.]|uniref:PqiC family protein n=1 Tax=Rhodopila sp. TaxID=2480087 RepID=UPI002D083641
MRRRTAFAVLATLLVSACSSGPAPAIYVLGGGGPVTDVAEPLAGRPVILVQRVLMPDYLDVTDIQVRQAGNVMHASSTGRWGERLSSAVRGALANDLGRALPGFVVT